MSFKLALDIGYFDPDTLGVARPVDPLLVKQAILNAGGRLLEDDHPEDAPRRRLAAAFAANGRPVVGFLGPEFVLLHESGFLMVAVGNVADPAVWKFFRFMVAYGCAILQTEVGIVTDSILEQFAAIEARLAVSRSSTE